MKQDPLTPDAREVAYGPGTGTGTVPHRGSCCGDFRFDSLRRLLFQGMTVTSMPERLASHLTRLLQASGAVVSKETLALSVWREEAVGDGNLAQQSTRSRVYWATAPAIISTCSQCMDAVTISWLPGGMSDGGGRGEPGEAAGGRRV